MRGDSLRDLYAKTLALFGLAMLAGVGALVDYWPASGAMPAVASPVLNTLPHKLPAFAALALSATAAPRSIPRPARGGATSLVGRRSSTVPPSDVSLDILPSGAVVPIADVVALGEPPLPIVTPVVATRVAAPEIELPPAPEMPFALTPVAPRSDNPSDGFFGSASSAFKKTGESIVNTTVKTGASIIKAFGFVGGAFKKVI